MKKIKIIILLFLSLSCFLIIGCEKKDKLLLECNTTIEDTKENIKIDFYKSKTAVRTVTVKKDKDAEEKIDALIKNYCNNQIKEDYSCEVEITEKDIVLTEKGLSKVIMGEVKEIGIKKYQKNLKMKGFKCQKDK